jgi:hypothetical protein
MSWLESVEFDRKEIDFRADIKLSLGET